MKSSCFSSPFSSCPKVGCFLPRFAWFCCCVCWRLDLMLIWSSYFTYCMAVIMNVTFFTGAKEKRFIPLLIDEDYRGKIPRSFSHITYLDFLRLEENDFWKKLATSLGWKQHKAWYNKKYVREVNDLLCHFKLQNIWDFLNHPHGNIKIRAENISNCCLYSFYLSSSLALFSVRSLYMVTVFNDLYHD